MEERGFIDKGIVLQDFSYLGSAFVELDTVIPLDTGWISAPSGSSCHCQPSVMGAALVSHLETGGRGSTGSGRLSRETGGFPLSRSVFAT